MSSTNEGDGGAKWHRAAHVSDIDEHWPCPVDIGGTCIALYRMENGIFATSGWSESRDWVRIRPDLADFLT